jgi:glycosyltransferase involved in cell wall biosynthesis
MKIIHVVENLDKGAVENWLVNVFLESKKIKPEWNWTFYCILGKEGRLDEKVKAAGGEIIYSPVSISQKFAFIHYLRKTLKQGRFDIIHSHHDYLSGFYLLASFNIHFRKRLLHIHNTDEALPVGNKVLHNLLLKPSHKLALHFSDKIVGISQDTLHLFSKRKRYHNKEYQVLYYGIDLSKFILQCSPVQFKLSLGIPANAKLLLFVGRMNSFKNPLFVVDILSEISKKRDDVFAVFVGKGDLEKEIELLAKQLHVNDKIRLLGWRDDTAAIMKCSDVFVFPRMEDPKEGLGLVVVEAQAAGLPMVLSHGIVEDAIVIKQLAHFLPLKNNVDEWTTTVLKILEDGTEINREQAFALMSDSRFELRTATENLLKLYE